MSSNIRINKVCQHCGGEFVAKTTVTKYCGDVCAKRAYKARKREEKIDKAVQDTSTIKRQELQALQSKEFLTVKEVASLLGCSVRTVYYQVNEGTIKSTNLGKRMTRIKRTDIDSLFE